MSSSTSSPNKNRLYVLLGTIALGVFWQVMSLNYNSVIVPSPYETFLALVDIIKNGELKTNLLISFKRQITGLTIGVLCGTATGILAGIIRPLEYFMLPVVNCLISIPAIIFVVMAMVWFGLGTTMAVFLVALLVFPLMHINTLEGFKSIDRSYLEMAKVFKIPVLVKLKKIYLPGIVHSFIAGFSLSAASSVRLTIMAELIGAKEGMGQKIAISRSYLETDVLFAWVIIIIIIIIMLEWLVIRPLNRFANSWKIQTGE